MMELRDPTEMPPFGHLCKFEKTVPAGGEWQLVTPNWLVLQLSEGIAYALEAKAG